MNLSEHLVQSRCEMMFRRQKPTLLIGGSVWADSGEVNDSLKALQFVFKLYEKQRSGGRYLSRRVQVCASTKKSKPRHEGFVKKLSGAEHDVKVTVNIDGIAKPTAWLSNAPVAARRLSELQGSRLIQRTCGSNQHGSEGPVDNNRLAEFDECWDLL